MTSRRQYDAFISYSHEADRWTAAKLHRLITRVDVPWYRRAQRRIFRDNSSIPFGSDLWGSIETALDNSRYFVYLASPAAANSQGVIREVLYWRRHDTSCDRFCMVLTGGDIRWDSSAQRFDWDASEALPKELKGWLDDRYRRFGDVRTRTWLDRLSRRRRLREAACLIVAQADGREPNEVIDADRRHVAAIRTTVGALGMIAILALSVGITQYKAAADAQALRVSQQLDQQALSEHSYNGRLALRLAIAADSIRSSSATRASLIEQTTTVELETQLAGPGNSVRSVAFSPHGSRLASGDNSGHVTLWETSDLAARPPVISASSKPIRAIAFSPSSDDVLAVASDDGTVSLWNVAQTVRLPVVLSAQRDFFTTLAFSPNGCTLASGSADGAVRLWNTCNPGSLTPLPDTLRVASEAITALAFSRQGDALAVGSSDKTVRLWSINQTTPNSGSTTPKVLSEGSAVTGIAFGPDSTDLAVGSVDGVTRLWNTGAVGQEWRVLPTSSTASVWAVAWSPNGRTVASATDDHRILRWNVGNRVHPSPIGTDLTRHTLPVDSLAFSPDGTELASGSVDRTVILWPTDSAYRPIPSVTLLHDNRITSLALAKDKDGQHLATGSDDTTTLITDLDAIGVTRTLKSTSVVFSVAFSADGRLLASASQDGMVRLVDPKSNLDPMIEKIGEPLSSVAFTPDGRMVIAASFYGGLFAWHTSKTGAEPPQRIGTPYGASIYAIAFSRDGKRFAVADADGSVQLWGVSSSGYPIDQNVFANAHTNAVTSVAFSPDGSSLLSGSFDGSVRLWSIDPQNNLGNATVLPLTSGDAPIRSVAFSEHGDLVAAGGDDKIVDVWDLVDPGLPRHLGEPLKGPSGPVRSVAFSGDDSQTVAAVSDDGTYESWDLTTLKSAEDHAVQMACHIADGGLTREEWYSYVPDYAYEDTCSES